jgi:hypothetical protein
MASVPGLIGIPRPGPWRRLSPIRLGILALALAVMAGVPLWWNLTRPPATVGSLPPMPTREAPGVAVNASAPQVRPIVIHSGRLADQAAVRSGRPPVRIELPSIGVQAAIVPVRVDPDSSSMQIPTDVDLVGWYRFSSPPGQPGSSVLVGHVDSAAQGPGAFFRLRELDVGSPVLVRLRGGVIRSFRVEARRSYPKEGLPALVFRRVGPPGLALITCGGAFDFTTRHYADNVVVFAVPVSR